MHSPSRILTSRFTIKNISPLLVVDELNTVIDYQQKQKPNPADDSEFSVKVSKASSEVTAVYKKDDVALTSKSQSEFRMTV